MLILSRKQDQEILIGDQIKITVLKTRGNTVRLGIEAPREVKVIRGELTAESDPSDDDQDDGAEFTIVFGSDSETDPETPDGPQNIQFRADHCQTDPHRGTHRTGNRISSEATTETVRFQGRLPRVLKHNRLKQIVDRIAVEKTGSRVTD